MKQLLKLLPLVFLFAACGGQQSKQATIETYYGQEISNEDVDAYHAVKDEVSLIGASESKIEGTILSTCAKKGCWMELLAEEDTVMVRFTDYGFFVPTEGAEGKHAIIQGEAFFDTLSVELLQHYAEDAGKSEEEILEITEPKYVMSFTADGVIIQE